MFGHDLKRLRQFNEGAGTHIKVEYIASRCGKTSRAIHNWMKKNVEIPILPRGEIRAIYERELKAKIDNKVKELVEDIYGICKCKVIMLRIVLERKKLILRNNTARIDNYGFSKYCNDEVHIDLCNKSLSTATLTGYSKIENLCGVDILNHSRKNKEGDLHSFISNDIVNSLLEIPFFLENNSKDSVEKPNFPGPVPAYLLTLENKLNEKGEIIEFVRIKKGRYSEIKKKGEDFIKKNGKVQPFTLEEIDKIEDVLKKHLSFSINDIENAEEENQKVKNIKYKESLTSILCALDFFSV